MLSLQKTYYHADYLKKSLNSTSIVWLIDVLNEILPVSEIKCGLSIQEKKRCILWHGEYGPVCDNRKGQFFKSCPFNLLQTDTVT